MLTDATAAPGAPVLKNESSITAHAGSEIAFLIQQFIEAYEGEPWFGRSATQLLADVTEQQALVQPAGQHSVLQLVWHMVNWRQFALSRLHPKASHDLHYFEANDWRQLPQVSAGLWQRALEALAHTQAQLLQALAGEPDALLDRFVTERSYNFRNLLHGVLQHDIYHLGQIAYITKMQKATGECNETNEHASIEQG